MSDTSYTVIIIILVIVIAYMILTIPARIARDKGYSFLKKSLMRRRDSFWGRKQLFGNSEQLKKAMGKNAHLVTMYNNIC